MGMLNVTPGQRKPLVLAGRLAGKTNSQAYPALTPCVMGNLRTKCIHICIHVKVHRDHRKQKCAERLCLIDRKVKGFLIIAMLDATDCSRCDTANLSCVFLAKPFTLMRFVSGRWPRNKHACMSD